MNRRKFIKNTAFASLGLGVLGFYSWQIEPHRLEFVRLKMPIKNLPDHLVGKTLMQISDLHTGKRVSSEFLMESFEKAKLYNPDFVVYTGDFITLHKGEFLRNVLEEVMTHSPRGTLGTLAILGNHDYGHKWKDSQMADDISVLIENQGIKVLRNQKTFLEGLSFIGIDDYWGTNFFPEKAMQKFVPSEPTIVLCHNPEACDLDIWNGYNGWILSGHTHGGQCKPPFLPPPILPVKNRRYTAGYFELSGNRKLYINRALGHSLQVRFNVRPEITIFELLKEESV